MSLAKFSKFKITELNSFQGNNFLIHFKQKLPVIYFAFQ